MAATNAKAFVIVSTPSGYLSILAPAKAEALLRLTPQAGGAYMAVWRGSASSQLRALESAIKDGISGTIGIGREKLTTDEWWSRLQASRKKNKDLDMFAKKKGEHA